VEARSVRILPDIPVDLQSGDQLLFLSTWDYDFYEARLVVAARKLREGEEPEVETSLAKKNPAPLMPEVWNRLYAK